MVRPGSVPGGEPSSQGGNCRHAGCVGPGLLPGAHTLSENYQQPHDSWLKSLGLRQLDGRPSEQAICEGYCKEKMSEFGSSWLWNKEKVCELLDGMQYRRGGSRADIEQHEDFVIIRGG